MVLRNISRRLINFSNNIFKACCVIGFTFQLVSILQLYFEYRTITEIKLITLKTLTPPDLTICTRYVDVIDYKLLARDTGLRFKLDVLRISGEQAWEVQEKLTIREILNYTPDSKNLVSSCVTRSPVDYAMTTRSDCSQEFKIEKFFNAEYVCFRLMQTFANTLKLKFSASALAWPGVLYQISLNGTTRDTGIVFKVVVHDNDIPYVSLPLGPWHRRNLNINGKREDNDISVTYRTVEQQLLPWPYSSNCRNYTLSGFLSAAHCEEHCLYTKMLSKLRKVPFSGIISLPINYKHISISDLKNASIVRDILEIEEICSYACRQLDCVMTHTLTYTDVVLDKRYFQIRIRIPQDPKTLISMRPALTSVEIFLYVLSVASTWFGISVISTNPFNLSFRWPVLHKRQSRQSEKCKHDNIELQYRVTLLERIINIQRH